MTNSSLVGQCVAPFMDAALFPNDQGFIPGRFCETIADLPGRPTCCLPCPATDYTYPASFKTGIEVTGWINVVGLVLMAFLLLSYVVLPTQQTRSHYLSVCLIVSIMMIAIGFTIPLGSKPEQCHNEITPNDMSSSLECAFSGAFVLAGALCVVMWVGIRALSMNLQICWDIIPGKRFFYLSQIFGWGIPAFLFTLTMTLTGVSFRLGDTCHVNHANAMADFWGPLMFMGCSAGILQLATFIYCINVYLKNLWTDQSGHSSHGSSTGLPSHNGGARAQTARAVYQRLKKVLWLQWRGIFIVTIILVNVIYFSIIFVYLDNLQSSIGKDWEKVGPWVICIVENPVDPDACTPLVDDWLVSGSTLISVLVLLSIAGIECFLLLARPSIFTAWWELITKGPSRQEEFINLDAANAAAAAASGGDSKHEVLHQNGRQSYVFEMQSKKSQATTVSVTETRPVSPVAAPGESYKGLLRSSHRPAESLATIGSHGEMSPPTRRAEQSFIDDTAARAPAIGLTYTPTISDYNPPDHSDAASGAYRQSSRQSFSTISRPTSSRSDVYGAASMGRGGLGYNPPSPKDEYSPNLHKF